MSLFEFTFGVSALILGLALTHLAATVQKLAYLGRRVRWAPEPVLLAGIIFLVIVQVWLSQWMDRNRTDMSIGQMILVILKMQAIYFGAASVFPEPREGDRHVDLLAHYDATRWLTFGSLITGLLLFQLHWFIAAPRPLPWSPVLVLEMLLYPALYLSLILIRWRPYNITLLAGGLLLYLWQISALRLTA